MDKENKDNLENDDSHSPKERIISYSEGGNKSPFCNSLSVNFDSDRQKISLATIIKN